MVLISTVGGAARLAAPLVKPNAYAAATIGLTVLPSALTALSAAEADMSIYVKCLLQVGQKNICGTQTVYSSPKWTATQSTRMIGGAIGGGGGGGA